MHRIVSILLLALFVESAPSVASAQSPELVTDRPDQTESATVIPRGLVQVEAGYLFARDGGLNRHEVLGTLFRIGLGGRTELRVGHAGVVGGGGHTGAGDTRVGGKVNLIAQPAGWRPELAILGGLSIPTGDAENSSNGLDPTLIAAFAHDLSPRMSLGYNLGAAWRSAADQPERDAFVMYSATIGFAVTDRLGTFLEFFGDRQTTGTTATHGALDAGVTFLLTKIIQLDAYAGGGLVGPTDSRFIGAGLSFRLPR